MRSKYCHNVGGGKSIFFRGGGGAVVFAQIYRPLHPKITEMRCAPWCKVELRIFPMSYM